MGESKIAIYLWIAKFRNFLQSDLISMNKAEIKKRVEVRYGMEWKKLKLDGWNVCELGCKIIRYE